MKKTLYLKILAGYLVFAILGFILISTFISEQITRKRVETEAANMYSQAVEIAATYGNGYFKHQITLEELKTHIRAVSGYRDTDIWIVSTTGRMLCSVQNSSKEAPLFIKDFNFTDIGDNYSQLGDFYGYFSEDYITVHAPITAEYNVVAYVFIHEPYSNIMQESNHLLNIMYLSASITFLLSFIVLLVFTYTVYLPLQKINRATQEYATGNFVPHIQLHSNDEIGYIARTLNFMSDKLATIEEDQRKFIANISHDFRSPLTSIKGYIDAILDGTIPPELHEKYLNIILTESNRLTKLTNSLLDLNRFGSHGGLLEISDFDINQVIRAIAQSCEGQCNEKRIQISLVLTGEEMLVSADLVKIQQVIYNLVDNAIKFSHENSVIIIETRCKNERLFISVKDSGIGIPRDSIRDIWNRFYKTDLSRGKDKKGTGLGLSIVKEIIQSHGQTINVISTEGVGTEFIFTLNLAKAELERE